MKGIIAIALLGACSYSMTSSGLFHGGGGGGSPSTSVASGGGGGGGGGGPVSGPELWKKWSTRGITLGVMDRAALKKLGFNCGKYPTQRCFKIMDKRCETGRCELKEDAFGQWFELNGAKTDLEYMTVATTNTDSAVVYDIRLMTMPRVVLEPASPLGKALIAKYGTPIKVEEPEKEDKVGGGRMIWWNEAQGNNGPNIYADCTSMHDKSCSIEIEDGSIEDTERSKQTALDDQRKRTNQPANAPQL